MVEDCCLNDRQLSLDLVFTNTIPVTGFDSTGVDTAEILPLEGTLQGSGFLIKGAATGCFDKLAPHAMFMRSSPIRAA